MKTEFKKNIKFTNEFNFLQKELKIFKVHTVCKEALCPNISECFSKKKLTFMIMGNVCTRNCKFCNVNNGVPKKLDISEVDRIIEIIRKLNLKYVVITSVTRDDLPDGGSEYFFYTAKKIKEVFPDIKLELLIPDFKKEIKNFDKIAFCGADVLSHNIETIERLYPYFRPQSDFKFSLKILNYLKELNPKIKTKSGFMVGIGETNEEIFELIKILYQNKVDALVIGQYFQPSKKNVPVERYLSDKEFYLFKKWAEEIGFKYILSERFARSSSLEILI